MTTYIALFRGINVGGKNVISMKALTEILEECGYAGVKTYIQSGNVLFRNSHSNIENFSQEVGNSIKSKYGFEPEIMVIDIEELQRAIQANPFPTDQPKYLHLYFLTKIPKQPDVEGLNRVKSVSERFQLIGKVFYLYAPDGIGRSKLAAGVERLIGVKATARNWNTITALLKMVSEEQSLLKRSVM